MATETVRYVGPPDQINYDVGAEVGNPSLVPGQEYELSSELALRVVQSSQHFEAVSFDVPEPPADDAPVDELTVTQLDERFGGLDGYPKNANRPEKLDFARQQTGQEA